MQRPTYATQFRTIRGQTESTVMAGNYPQPAYYNQGDGPNFFNSTIQTHHESSDSIVPSVWLHQSAKQPDRKVPTQTDDLNIL